MLKKITSIKHKVVLILISVWLMLGAVNILVEYQVLYPRFATLEQEGAGRNLFRSVDAIWDNVDHLNTTCRDWAFWDDTCHFIATRSDDYQRVNLGLSTFRNNGIHLIYFYDSQGRMVWGRAYDKDFKHQASISAMGDGFLPVSHPFFAYERENVPLVNFSVSGFLMTPQGPMLLASRPILTSDGGGPIQGTLIMGRFLNDKLIRDFAARLHQPFNVLPYTADAVPETAKVCNIPDSTGRSCRMVHLDRKTLAAYAVINDVMGNPAVVVKAETRREISSRGREAIRYSIVSNFIGMAGMFIVALCLLQRAVIGPIERLRKQIADLAFSGATGAHLPPQGKDEIGSLGEAFGGLISQLDAKAEELRRFNEVLRRDIEKRKKTEADLHEAQALLQAAFEQSPAGLVIADAPDVRIRLANPAGVAIIGGEEKNLTNIPGELIPTRWRTFYPDGRAYAPDDLPICRAVKYGEVTRNHEMMLRNAAGEDRWIYINAGPVYDEAGQIIAGIGFYMDITESKQAQEALRASEERFRSYVENASEVIFTMDSTGNYTYFSPNIFDLFGITESEMTGRNYKEFTHPDDIEARDAYMARVLKGEKMAPLPHRVLGKDGEYVWRQTSLSTVRNRNGEITFLGIVRSIDEERRMQKEQEALRERLGQAQKMEALGLLAGGVAHDLNNVLSGIVSYPELLLLDLPQDSPLRQPILTIQQSGRKAADIVEDLLTLARRGVMNTEVLNLNDIITDYLASAEHRKLLSFYSGLSLDVSLDPDALNIRGVPIHLRKTVMNLVTNAAEAHPVDGKIVLATENRYLDRALKGYDSIQPGDYVVLRVADKGIGIDKEDLKRIFEPFYTKKVMGRSGTGLGMAVVWGTVQDHKGYIDIDSEPGKGTVCELFFPVTQESRLQVPETFDFDRYRGNGEMILIVDDIEAQRDIASSILTKAGYRTVSVPSGEKAVDYLSHAAVDLVLLDMIMDPGMDGLSTYQQILGLNPKQKVVIASGFSETDRVKEALRLGVMAYIKKPYSLEKILTALAAALAPNPL
ncbi:MAG: CHASE4 domain-containing protein [Desulfobacterales bacterium]|jgi:PAS domain S-box-containing protein|nr:CHASE4 domain-containing protein [Desulfobacterales bacterium]